MATYPDSLWTFTAPNTTETVNLNNQGLSNGDNIDQYLDQHWGDGVRVEVDPGTYAFDGSGLQRDLADASLIGTGARGDVVLDGGGHNVTMRATGGTVLLENLEVRGTPGNNFRVEAPESTAEIVCEHVVLPTGGPDGSDVNGFFACGDPCNTIHNGTLRLLWCQALGHSDNGMYADGPSDVEPGDGRVVVVGGEYRGNNIADVRVGTTNTDVYRTTIHADGTHPEHENGGLNARGLRIRQPGDNLYINDCDIQYDTSGGGAVTFDNDGAYGSGTIENTRIENNASDRAAITSDDPSTTDNNWTATDIHISGSGDLSSDLTLEGDSVVGTDATTPDMTVWWGSDVGGGSNQPDTNMADFVFPEDTGTGASDGDASDAANFASLADGVGHSDFVVSGLTFNYQSTGPAVDVAGGKAVLSDTSATAGTENEPRHGVAYVVEVEDRFDIALVDGAINHIWVTADLTVDDAPSIVTDTNSTNAPAEPTLKLGEINTSTNEVTEVSRAPVVNGQRVLLTDTATRPTADGEFRMDSGNVFVQSGGAVFDLTDIGTDTTATASGDGSTVTFSLAHNHGATPSVAHVMPTSADAAGAFYKSGLDGTAVEITYTTAPPSGTDNLTYDIIAR